MANRVGNDQLKAIHEDKDRLAREIADWERDRDLIRQRLPRWKQLVTLLDHAADLPVAAEVRPEADAIEKGRRLLAEPDPVPGMVEKLTAALRAALNEDARPVLDGPRGPAGGAGGHAHLEEADAGAAVRRSWTPAASGSCRRSPWGPPRRSSTRSGTPG